MLIAVAGLAPLSWEAESNGVENVGGEVQVLRDLRVQTSGGLRPRRGWFIYETWSWAPPGSLSEGDDGVLSVTRDTENRSFKTSQRPMTYLTDRMNLRELERGDPNCVERDRISVEGDFNWSSIRTQPASSEMNSWTWLYTATTRGNKFIRVLLPCNSRSSYVVRSLPDGVSVTDRQILIPVFVGGRFGLSKDLELVAKGAIGFIGFLFTAPLLVEVFKKSGIKVSTRTNP